MLDAAYTGNTQRCEGMKGGGVVSNFQRPACPQVQRCAVWPFCRNRNRKLEQVLRFRRVLCAFACFFYGPLPTASLVVYYLTRAKRPK